jgi:hypothetical protein
MLARLISVRLFAALLFAIPVVTIPALRSALAADDKEKEDETDEGGEGEDDAKPDLDQPLVTAGGNYGMANFPLTEVERTLLIPQNGLELQLNYATDIRSKAAGSTDSQSFKTHTFVITGTYGIGPTTNIFAGFLFDAAAPDGATKDRAVIAGLEQAIVYDLLDVAAGAQINFNSPASGSSDTLVDVFIGLPIKYRINKMIAIQGLEKILNIHTKGVPSGVNADGSIKTDSTPDFLISVAGVVNPIPQLALILRVGLNLTAASFDQRTLPVELDVQYTLSRALDIGLQVIARNIAPPSGAPGVASLGALDNIGFGLFVRGRM